MSNLIHFLHSSSLRHGYFTKIQPRCVPVPEMQRFILVYIFCYYLWLDKLRTVAKRPSATPLSHVDCNLRFLLWERKPY